MSRYGVFNVPLIHYVAVSYHWHMIMSSLLLQMTMAYAIATTGTSNSAALLYIKTWESTARFEFNHSHYIATWLLPLPVLASSISNPT